MELSEEVAKGQMHLGQKQGDAKKRSPARPVSNCFSVGGNAPKSLEVLTSKACLPCNSGMVLLASSVALKGNAKRKSLAN